MKQSDELRIFELCRELATLFGNKEAVANLTRLYNKHKEMFKDMEEVSNVIKEVVKEPEIIVDATHSNKDIGIFKAAKRLDSKKMGDVVIKNKNGINNIFHANKKNIKEFYRLHRQVEVGSRDAHFLHPDLKSAWAGLNKHLPTNNNIIPKSTNNNQADYSAKLKELESLFF